MCWWCCKSVWEGTEGKEVDCYGGGVDLHGWGWIRDGLCESSLKVFGVPFETVGDILAMSSDLQVSFLSLSEKYSGTAPLLGSKVGYSGYNQTGCLALDGRSTRP